MARLSLLLSRVSVQPLREKMFLLSSRLGNHEANIFPFVLLPPKNVLVKYAGNKYGTIHNRGQAAFTLARQGVW